MNYEEEFNIEETKQILQKRGSIQRKQMNESRSVSVNKKSHYDSIKNEKMQRKQLIKHTFVGKNKYVGKSSHTGNYFCLLAILNKKIVPLYFK